MTATIPEYFKPKDTIPFNYPLRYNKGIVDGKYPIIRTDRIENKPEFFVYFKVPNPLWPAWSDTIYVGYACYIFPGMGIEQAKIAKDQAVKPIHEEYCLVPRRTKVRQGSRIKLRHHTRQRVFRSNYADEPYHRDEEIRRIEIIRAKYPKTRAKELINKDEKLRQYVQNQAERLAIELAKNGHDGVDTELPDEKMPASTTDDGYGRNVAAAAVIR